MALKIPEFESLAMNMTPMIDIVFNLVQFFMLTLDLSHKELAVLDLPQANQRVAGRAYFSGFALSPYGIKSVTLLFQNGRVRIAPFLFDDPALRRRFPWYDATTRPRFVREIERRLDGVGERTDVQVEIVDGKGRRVLLEDRFFVWPDRR